MEEICKWAGTNPVQNNFKQAERLLNANHLIKCGKSSPNDGSCAAKVTALCLKTSNLTDVPYEIVVKIGGDDSILSVVCSCKAGTGEKCKHCVATLLHCFSTMVVVANEPIEESEPMMKAEECCDGLSNKLRRTSCADEAYKNITGSMKADPLHIRSPKTAIELLSTGARLQNMPLVKQCIENLDRQLDKTNILMIYSCLSKCKLPTGNKDEFEPSAPPIIENEEQRNTDWLEELTNNLRHNCLLMIDKHADYVLKQKEILDLSYLDLISITERDSLQVSDEMLIYSVIYRWAIEECNRRKLNIHLLNMKAVIRQLNYTPRYGLISKAKFVSKMIDNIKGPTRSEILEEKEWRLIKFYIEEKSKKRPVEELPHKWSRPRIIGNEKPYVLSSRSSSPHVVNTSSTTLRANCQNKTTCENCLLHFLTCWTAIFD